MGLGEDRVRYKFNPSGNTLVDDIKRRTAELINIVHDLREDARANDEGGEIARLCNLAMTHYEDAAMWAVKAATSH